MPQIPFVDMNTTISTDAADAPHVLGDPADAAFAGTAELCNNNFALFNTWAVKMQNAWFTGIDLDNAVMVPGGSFTYVDGGYARGQRFLLSGTARLCSVWLSVWYIGGHITASGPASGDLVTNVAVGTLAANYRPNTSNDIAWVGRFTNGTSPILEMPVGLAVTTGTGAISITKLSCPNVPIPPGSMLTLTATYITPS